MNFLLAHDKRGVLLFSPLQSETGQQILKQAGLPPNDFGSFLLYEDGRVSLRSDAALRVAALLGPPWSFGSFVKIVPRAIRDGVYDWVARNRYKWFGKHDTCRLPTPQERARFV